MNLTIPGRVPSKKNSRVIFRRGGKIFNIPSEAYNKWHKKNSLLLTGLKYKGNIFIMELRFYMPDNRKCDLTNKAESIMDLLVDCGVISDDNWQTVPKLYLLCEGIDKENPRVDIKIIGGDDDRKFATI